MGKNWKTTVFGILGAILAVLGFFMPEVFTPENSNAIVANLDSIITAVLALIAIFAAKDELKIDNV